MAKALKQLGTVLGTYCPLDGSMHLSAVEWEGQVWVYCPLGATGPGDAHTAFPIERYVEDRDEMVAIAPAALEKRPSVPETKED